jgi:hypothetical protein
MKITLHIVALPEIERYADTRERHFYFDLDLNFTSAILILEGLTLVREGPKHANVMFNKNKIGQVELPEICQELYPGATPRDTTYTFTVRGATRKL